MSFLSRLDKILRNKMAKREPYQMAKGVSHHEVITAKQEKAASQQAADLQKFQADLRSYRSG